MRSPMARTYMVIGRPVDSCVGIDRDEVCLGEFQVSRFAFQVF